MLENGQLGPPLVLASRSPRRRDLLNRAGFDHTAQTPEVDDSDLSRPNCCPPHHWVSALAYFKAASVADSPPPLPAGTCPLILGADTVCLLDDGNILGQPRDPSHARSMIQTMANTTHSVVTGVALLNPRTKTRLIFSQSSIVRVGHIGAQAIDEYLASNMWQGKAGAYNLEERIEAGWPISYQGDPTTVMGLPMNALSPILTTALARTASQTEEVSR